MNPYANPYNQRDTPPPNPPSSSTISSVSSSTKNSSSQGTATTIATATATSTKGLPSHNLSSNPYTTSTSHVPISAQYSRQPYSYQTNVSSSSSSSSGGGVSATTSNTSLRPNTNIPGGIRNPLYNPAASSSSASSSAAAPKSQSVNTPSTSSIPIPISSSNSTATTSYGHQASSTYGAQSHTIGSRIAINNSISNNGYNSISNNGGSDKNVVTNNSHSFSGSLVSSNIHSNSSGNNSNNISGDYSESQNLSGGPPKYTKSYFREDHHISAPPPSVQASLRHQDNPPLPAASSSIPSAYPAASLHAQFYAQPLPQKAFVASSISNSSSSSTTATSSYPPPPPIIPSPPLSLQSGHNQGYSYGSSTISTNSSLYAAPPPRAPPPPISMSSTTQVHNGVSNTNNVTGANPLPSTSSSPKSSSSQTAVKPAAGLNRSTSNSRINPDQIPRPDAYPPCKLFSTNPLFMEAKQDSTSAANTNSVTSLFTSSTTSNPSSTPAMFYPAVPPQASSCAEYRTLDEGNSGPRFFRATTVLAPASTSVEKDCGIPYAICASPFSKPENGESHVPTVFLGYNSKISKSTNSLSQMVNGPPDLNDPDFSAIPIRCSRCQAYINPFVTWQDGGNTFVCNLCSMGNEVPEWYRGSLDTNGQRVDRMSRYELHRGSVDFVVGREFANDLPSLNEKLIVFAVDVSIEAVNKGIAYSSLCAIRRVVARICSENSRMVASGLSYADRDVRIGIVTFNKKIHFYEVNAATYAEYRAGASPVITEEDISSFVKVHVVDSADPHAPLPISKLALSAGHTNEGIEKTSRSTKLPTLKEHKGMLQVLLSGIIQLLPTVHSLDKETVGPDSLFRGPNQLTCPLATIKAIKGTFGAAGGRIMVMATRSDNTGLFTSSLNNFNAGEATAGDNSSSSSSNSSNSSSSSSCSSSKSSKSSKTGVLALRRGLEEGDWLRYGDLLAVGNSCKDNRDKAFLNAVMNLGDDLSKLRVVLDCFIAAPDDVESNNDVGGGGSTTHQSHGFFRPNDFNDTALLADVADRSGGEVVVMSRDVCPDKYASLSPDFAVGCSSKAAIARLSKRLWVRICCPVASDVTMKLRSTPGFQVDSIISKAAYKSEFQELSIPLASASLTATFMIKNTLGMKENTPVYFQLATLYRDIQNGNVWKVRVHNYSTIATSSMTKMFRSADQDAVTSVLMRIAARDASSGPLFDARKNLVSRVSAILLNYRSHCSQQSPKQQLILPEALKLLPLYCLGMLKHPSLLENFNLPSDPFAASYSQATQLHQMFKLLIKDGERAYILRRIKSATIRDIICHIYPRLYNISPDSFDGDAVNSLVGELSFTTLQGSTSSGSVGSIPYLYAQSIAINASSCSGQAIPGSNSISISGTSLPPAESAIAASQTLQAQRKDHDYDYFLFDTDGIDPTGSEMITQYQSPPKHYGSSYGSDTVGLPLESPASSDAGGAALMRTFNERTAVSAGPFVGLSKLARPPRCTSTTAESFNNDGIFLLDDGERLYLYIGRNFRSNSSEMFDKAMALPSFINIAGLALGSAQSQSAFESSPKTPFSISSSINLSFSADSSLMQDLHCDPQVLSDRLQTYASSSQGDHGLPRFLEFRSSDAWGASIISLVERLRESADYRQDITVIWPGETSNSDLNRFGFRLVEDSIYSQLGYVKFLCDLHTKITSNL